MTCLKAIKKARKYFKSKDEFIQVKVEFFQHRKVDEIGSVCSIYSSTEKHFFEGNTFKECFKEIKKHLKSENTKIKIEKDQSDATKK